MGWRSQQTLNCKGDEYLRTWKRKEDTTGKGGQAMVRLTQQRGWGLKGTSISLLTVFGCDLNLPEPDPPGNVYVDWGRRGCACLTPGDLNSSKRVRHRAPRRWALATSRGSWEHQGVVSTEDEWFRWVVTGWWAAGWWAWCGAPGAGSWGVRLEF